MLDFERFEAVSFDCCGTLIDWESGLRTPPTKAGQHESRPCPGT